MNTLEQGIQLNNEAASLLQSGSIVEAAHLLHRALATLKASEFGSVEESATAAASWPTQGSGLPDSAEGGVWHNQDGLTYIYDHPHILSTDMIATSSPEQRDHLVHSMSMHVIFNLALAYHLQGQITGAEELMAGAIRLYEMVLASADLISMGIVGPEKLDNALWCCMIWNNLAQLHCELCAYDRSRYCMKRVAHVTRHTNCLCHAIQADILTDDEVSAFSLNILTLTQFPTAAKAA